MSSLHPPVLDVVKARLGTRIRGKWHVDALLGVGGMGAVYAATHRNGSRVALKVLHPQLSVDGEIRARFAREGYVANSVDHPGVVRVLDDDETEDGAAFLVMELLAGETAEARAARLGGRLPLEDVLALADALLDVLVAAHAAGVVHRDIKPENIFFARDGRIKVLDFGIARLREGSFPPGSNTRNGVTMGTPAFMPPEQAMGRVDEVDALSDIWAVGATLFALASGRPVHDAATPMESVIFAATAKPRSLAAASPGQPPALVHVVDRALAFQKADRWPSARVMQGALREAFAAPQAAGASNAPASSALPSSAGRMRTSTIPPWVEERKLATVLLADLLGFDALAADLEPEAMRELANAFFDPLSREVEREAGTVVKYVGNALMAVFGVPTSREDDAERAVRCAIAMVGRTRAIAQRERQSLALRVGISSGVVMVGTVGGGAHAVPDVVGATVTLATRLEEAAAPGHVAVSAATERLVRHRFEIVPFEGLTLPGSSDPVPAFRVIAERGDEVASARLRAGAPSGFFARRGELDVLVHLFDVAAREHALRVVELTGEVGLGKTHLVRELGAALASRPTPPTLLRASRGSAMAPLGFLGRVLRSRFRVRADEEPEIVRARVIDGVAAAWPRAELEDGREAGRLLAELVAPLPAGPLLGTELAGDRTRTTAAFADWLGRLAAEQPVVLVLEQVQWGDEPSLEVFEYLLRALRRAPVLLVLSARPGSGEELPPWLTACDVRTQIKLEPFTREEMGLFVDDLFRSTPNMPREIKNEIAERAEGNPALCKELVRLLVDRGALVVDDGDVPIRWEKGRSSQLVLPDTVLGVLQARLDGLPAAEKELLKLAAVVGRTFWTGALEVLAPQVPKDEIARLLESLMKRDLLRLSALQPSAERELAFATQALRDTAYALLPAGARKAAHRTVADWLLARGDLWEGAQAGLALHLEAAGDHERARRHYLSAARHALGVFAYREALACFDRMEPSWPAAPSRDDRVQRAGVLRERAVAEARLGRFEASLASLSRAEEDLHAANVPPGDAVYAWLALERGLVLKESARAREAIAALSEGLALVAGQPEGLLHMRFYSARAFLRATHGEREASREDVREGLRIGQALHVRDASWHAAMARLEDAGGASSFVEERFDEAEKAYQRALEHRELGGDAVGLQDAYVNLGGVAFSRRDFPAAVAYYDRALASARRLRWATREALGLSNLGQAKLTAGDLAGAKRELTQACRMAEEGGYSDVLADSTRALAEAELALGDLEEARETADDAVALAERTGVLYFRAMAHAAAMDVALATTTRTHEKRDFDDATRHKDLAVALLREAGAAKAAEEIEIRFRRGSSSTVNT